MTLRILSRFSTAAVMATLVVGITAARTPKAFAQQYSGPKAIHEAQEEQSRAAKAARDAEEDQQRAMKKAAHEAQEEVNRAAKAAAHAAHEAAEQQMRGR